MSAIFYSGEISGPEERLPARRLSASGGERREGLEAEDKAGAEADLVGCGDVEGIAAADIGAADGGQGAVSDLQDTEVDVLLEGVIDASVEGVIELADMDGTGWGFSGAVAEGELSVWLNGSLEALVGDTRTQHKAPEQSIVAMQIGLTQVESRRD